MMRDFQDVGAQIASRIGRIGRFDQARFGLLLDVPGQQETARAERDSQHH